MCKPLGRWSRSDVVSCAHLPEAVQREGSRARTHTHPRKCPEVRSARAVEQTTGDVGDRVESRWDERVQYSAPAVSAQIHIHQKTREGGWGGEGDCAGDKGGKG
jgi:hypothetical protein